MTMMWNLWHGCHKISERCQHCYVYRRDECAVAGEPFVFMRCRWSHSLVGGSPSAIPGSDNRSQTVPVFERQEPITPSGAE